MLHINLGWLRVSIKHLPYTHYISTHIGKLAPHYISTNIGKHAPHYIGTDIGKLALALQREQLVEQTYLYNKVYRHTQYIHNTLLIVSTIKT